ncbi:MAG: S1C family serine protease [Thermomicrobiales bacterium]
MSGTEIEGGLLQRFSDELAGAVATAGKSVVRVNARRRLPGTGIVWTADDGGATIVSANHIVERDEEITVVTADGQELPAKLAGRDPASDLAVLKVEGAALTAATHATEAQTKVGGLVLALGRAGELSATLGVVSAFGGPWEGGRGRRFTRLISSDAPMFPGYSGGPLIDASGRVLGLLSSHLGRGMTLAIPSDEVDHLVAAIGTHGRVRRGYLGVGAQPVALPSALKAATNQEHGLLLVTVEDDGPAARGGLTIGDIIVGINGQPVQGLDDLRGALGTEQVGQALTVRVLRGGQAQDRTITPGEQPA